MQHFLNSKDIRAWSQNQRFAANCQPSRKKMKRNKIAAKDFRRIKREATRKPFSSSAAMFQNCNWSVKKYEMFSS